MEKNTMKPVKKITLLLILSLSVLLPSGCSTPQEQARGIILSDLADGQSGSVAKRFQESAPQSPTAVDSAIELSQQYAKLSEEAAVLRQQNQDLITKNQQLKERVTILEADLQQTQKELSEANDFLVQLRLELNNWKTNVLGFRDEMRDAQKAQLEALLKILKALGGEVTKESALQEGPSSTAPPNDSESDKPGEPQPQETAASGG
jgi:chromosome segregation ATPase